MDTQETKQKSLSGSCDKRTISERLDDIAQKLKYGSVTVEFTISRGKVAKAVIKEKTEVVLL